MIMSLKCPSSCVCVELYLYLYGEDEHEYLQVVLSSIFVLNRCLTGYCAIYNITHAVHKNKLIFSFMRFQKNGQQKRGSKRQDG